MWDELLEWEQSRQEPHSPRGAIFLSIILWAAVILAAALLWSILQ